MFTVLDYFTESSLPYSKFAVSITPLECETGVVSNGYRYRYNLL